MLTIFGGLFGFIAGVIVSVIIVHVAAFAAGRVADARAAVYAAWGVYGLAVVAFVAAAAAASFGIRSVASWLPALPVIVTVLGREWVKRAPAAARDPAQLQASVARAQQQMLQILSLDDGFAAARDAQGSAIAAQEQVVSSLAEAEAAADPARGGPRTPVQRELEHHVYHLNRANADLKELPPRIEQLSKQVAAMEAAMGPSKSNPSLRAPLDHAYQARRRDLGDTRRALESAPKRVKEHQAKVDAIMARPEAIAPGPLSPEGAALENLCAKALHIHARAEAEQAKVAEALAAPRATPTSAPAGAVALQAQCPDPVGVLPVRHARHHAAIQRLQRRRAIKPVTPRHLLTKPSVRDLLRLHRALLRTGL